jgi:hypothetical protein
MQRYSPTADAANASTAFSAVHGRVDPEPAALQQRFGDLHIDLVVLGKQDMNSGKTVSGGLRPELVPGLSAALRSISSGSSTTMDVPA